MSFINLYLAVEDALSEAIGYRLVHETLGKNTHVQVLCKGGNGYLRSNLDKFMTLASRYPVLLLTDLDNVACAPALKAEWFNGKSIPDKLMFRVAVREAEAWILSDRSGVANFLGVSDARIPRSPDAIADPMQTLVNLARRAKRGLREDLVPTEGSLTPIGIGYNKRLSSFVEKSWNLSEALSNSDSLRRAYRRLAEIAN